MARTNVDIDDQTCAEVMRRYRLATKHAAINLALRLLAAEIAVCDAVRMEVLAGARDEAHLVRRRRWLARAAVIPTLATDYDDAAAL